MGSSGLSLKSAPEREPIASMMQAAAAEGRANALENAMKAVNTSRPSSGMQRHDDQPFNVPVSGQLG